MLKIAPSSSVKIAPSSSVWVGPDQIWCLLVPCTGVVSGPVRVHNVLVSDATANNRQNESHGTTALDQVGMYLSKLRCRGAMSIRCE